jgi:hypothetical protein
VQARVEDGTVKLSRAKWESQRVYLSTAMVGRLEDAARAPKSAKKLSPAEWLTMGPAAREAGVSAATLCKWAERGEVQRTHDNGRWKYHRTSLRARARGYWRTVRFHRAQPPQWLAQEQAPGIGARAH